jgi:hypothetical protein
MVVGWIERALLGRSPVFAPIRLARRLLGRSAGGPRHARAIGALMRWSYGSLLGVLYSATLGRVVRRRWPEVSSLPGGLTLGAAVLLFELIALPRSGATEKVARWPIAEQLLLAGQTAAFGVTVETARRALEPA